MATVMLCEPSIAVRNRLTAALVPLSRPPGPLLSSVRVSPGRWSAVPAAARSGWSAATTAATTGVSPPATAAAATGFVCAGTLPSGSSCGLSSSAFVSPRRSHYVFEQLEQQIANLSSDLPETVRRTKAQLGDQRRRLDRLVDFVADGRDSAAIRERLADTERNVALLGAQIDDLTRRARHPPKAPSLAWVESRCLDLRPHPRPARDHPAPARPRPRAPDLPEPGMRLPAHRRGRRRRRGHTGLKKREPLCAFRPTRSDAAVRTSVPASR